MNVFAKDGNRLLVRVGGELLWLEAWGKDAIRVRGTRNSRMQENTVQALLPTEAIPATIEYGDGVAYLKNGQIQAQVRYALSDMDIFGGTVKITFMRPDGTILLEEEPPHFVWPPARHYEAAGGDLWRLEVRFKAQAEHIYGLGQPQHGLLDQKGCTIRLLQQNSQTQIPFYYSSRGYGFLWNNPAVGRVELSNNGTTWVAEASPQLDYWITAGANPKEVLYRYSEVTGRAPRFPDWALGFWQCKLRYDTQEKVLQVVREHKRRGLPMDILVIDFFHWTRMGDWRFNPADFPDPSAMVQELRNLGIELMVSVWPTVTANSENFDEMRRKDYLVRAEQGLLNGMLFRDNIPEGRTHIYYFDAFNPEARQFVWKFCKQNYFDLGIRSFWLDVNEPEMYPMHPGNIRYFAGNGRAVSNAYPLFEQQGFYEGLRAAGAEVLMLSRSAWAGSQRYGVCVWSGDIQSTFEAFRKQVVAGLSMAISGIPWWTTDIGGFHNGDIADPAFQELLVRWFQWGVFCPVFRLHGFRQDSSKNIKPSPDWRSGADNEIWSFGEHNYAILRDYLFLRERIRPYVAHLMQEASERGVPPMRPLFLEFPEDRESYLVDDTYLFGPDLLVAPILELGQRERRVYLPQGARWLHVWSGQNFAGGRWVTVEAPLSEIPLFLRDDASLPIKE